MNTGTVQLFVGPMFSGKSELLIKNLQEQEKKGLSLLAIRFRHDTRYSDKQIASHNGDTFSASSATTSSEIKSILNDYPTLQVLGIDEVQFFDEGLVAIVEELKNKSVAVILAGLDYDYQGNIWETTELLRTIADKTKQLFATCTICHRKIATKTQRIKNNSDRVVIGGEELYEPRCEEHFEKN